MPSEKKQPVSFAHAAQRTPAILIVEDEILVRLALSDFLQECGFKVFEAGSVEEAIEALTLNETAIDLVFSDVHLKGALTGFDLAKWVRENQPGLPFVLTSGDQKKAAAANELCEAEPFLAKPYDLEIAVKQFRALIAAKEAKK